MKFIKVHSKVGNEPIYINIKRIQSFSKAFDDENATILNMNTADFYYYIIETPEEIIKLIEEADKVGRKYV